MLAVPELLTSSELDRLTQRALTGGSNRGMSTVWHGVVRDRHGRVKHCGRAKANLRVNAGNDWQAACMTGSPNKGETGTATSTTATTLVNTGASFPTTAVISGATGGYAGQIICVGPNSSGTGSTVWGVIVSNTATTITVDRWVSASSPFTAGTTPNGTGQYQILPVMAPMWYLALSSTAITPAAADVTLSGELSTGGFSRTNYTTRTHTAASSSVALANTFTASATQTINSEALLSALGTGGIGSASTGGVMGFENTEPNPPTLVSGDTLAQTVTITY